MESPCENLSLIVRPRFDLILYSSNELLFRDKDIILLKQGRLDKYIVNLKEVRDKFKVNFINLKKLLENNPLYQKVVLVFSTNSFLTKLYFVIYLSLGCIFLG